MGITIAELVKSTADYYSQGMSPDAIGQWVKDLQGFSPDEVKKAFEVYRGDMSELAHGRLAGEVMPRSARIKAIILTQRETRNSGQRHRRESCANHCQSGWVTAYTKKAGQHEVQYVKRCELCHPAQGVA